VTGAAALIWCVALVADLVIAQRSARDALRRPPVEQPLLVPFLDHVPPDPGRAPATPGPALAMLTIPRIGLSAAVLHGSDAGTLRRGPGHLENTAHPGQNGNAVIAGHRDTFFRPLRNIRIGDDIFLDSPSGQFRYQVTSLRVVSPRDLSVLAPTEEAMLTLITCYPFWVLGHAPDRFIVRARRVDSSGPAPLEARMHAPLELAAPPSLVPSSGPASALVVTRAAPGDDVGLVRQAVGRYLSLHGLHLVTRLDAHVSGDRTFTCDVTFDEDQATAACDPVADAPAGDASPGRTFALERSHDAWAIRSIVLK
jgi:LPXTG-site transpeptidase (sortase) family protein